MLNLGDSFPITTEFQNVQQITEWISGEKSHKIHDSVKEEQYQRLIGKRNHGHL